MVEAKVIGKSEADRQRVLALHQTYLDANAVFDWETLRDQLWSAEPGATFFNLNGHTYVGRDHWIALWTYYKLHLNTGVWTPYDMGGEVGADVAVIWCHRKTKMAWIGTDPRPEGEHHQDRSFISRSTMVFKKESGDWRVVHVHFSEASTEPRPGGI